MKEFSMLYKWKEHYMMIKFYLSNVEMNLTIPQTIKA